MGLFYPAGTQVGHVNLRNTPGQRQGRAGLAIFMRAKLHAEDLPWPSNLSLEGEAWIDEERGLDTFRFQLDSADMTGSIEGQVAEGMLRASITVGEETYPLEFPVHQRLLLGYGGVLNAPVLAPGEETTAQVFDPTTFTVKKARILCTGRENLQLAGETINALMMTSTIGGKSTQSWVSTDGQVLRAELPLGLVLERIAPIEQSDSD